MAIIVINSCNFMFPGSIELSNNITGRKDAKYTSTNTDKRSYINAPKTLKKNFIKNSRIRLVL